MGTPAEPPFVIFQEVSAGNQFTKVDPDAGPERDGVIWKFPNRNKGGRFLFSNNIFFQIRRVLFDFADADSWAIYIGHAISEVEVALNSAVASAQKQVVQFTVTGGTDGDYTITINGTDYTVTATSLTAEQIAAQLQLLVDDDDAVDAVVLASPDDDTVEVSSVVAGLAFTYSSSSTGDPITETVVSENEGSAGVDGASLQRFDIVRELAPGETVLVETTGATQVMFAEVLAYPSLSNQTTTFDP